MHVLIFNTPDLDVKEIRLQCGIIPDIEFEHCLTDLTDIEGADVIKRLSVRKVEWLLAFEHRPHTDALSLPGPCVLDPHL